MNTSGITENICGGIIGLVFLSAFFLMFGWAALKGDFIFQYGRIRGKLARIIGVVGLVGITAGAYLGINQLVFDVEPPFVWVAYLLCGLLIVVLIVVRFLSLFFWHPK